jgi:hypothetical protein
VAGAYGFAIDKSKSDVYSAVTSAKKEAALAKANLKTPVKHPPLNRREQTQRDTSQSINLLTL